MMAGKRGAAGGRLPLARHVPLGSIRPFFFEP